MTKTKRLMAALVAAAFATSAFADDKKVTITGEGQ